MLNLTRRAMALVKVSRKFSADVCHPHITYEVGILRSRCRFSSIPHIKTLLGPSGEPMSWSTPSVCSNSWPLNRKGWSFVAALRRSTRSSLLRSRWCVSLNQSSWKRCRRVTESKTVLDSGFQCLVSVFHALEYRNVQTSQGVAQEFNSIKQVKSKHFFSISIFGVIGNAMILW